MKYRLFPNKRHDEAIPSLIARTQFSRTAKPEDPESAESPAILDEPTSVTMPSSFMIFPPEIRELIYEFYFLSAQKNGATSPVGIDRQKLSNNHVHSFSGFHIAYPPLLHVNRTICREASKPFFEIMTFEMRFPLLPHGESGCKGPRNGPWDRRSSRCDEHGYEGCPFYKNNLKGFGGQHEQCCSFPSYEDRVREMLLSEPNSLRTTSFICSVSLDAETLCPRIFLILNRCCPALKSMTLDVGKSGVRESAFSSNPWAVRRRNVPAEVPRRLPYCSNLLFLGLTFLPGLTYLGFRLAMWRYQMDEDETYLQNVFLNLQKLSECLRERFSGLPSRGWDDLTCEAIPVFVEPHTINVHVTRKTSGRCRQALKLLWRNPYDPADPFDDVPDWHR